MAPPGKTSLLVEFPHFPGDEVCGISESKFGKNTLEILEHHGLARLTELIFTHSLTIPHTYPVVEVDSVQSHEQVLKEIAQIHNLRMAGRSGKFVYTNVHDMMREGRLIAEEMGRSVLVQRFSY